MDRHRHRRMMSLGAFVHETGQHVAGWRHPDADTGAGTDFGQMVDAVRTAERGLFDLFFLADSAAVNLIGNKQSQGRIGKVVKFEPITVLSALAALTTHIGLVGTACSTYGDPYSHGAPIRLAGPDQRRPGWAGTW